MKKIDIKLNGKRITKKKVKLEPKLVIPDFSSIKELKGDINVIDYAFKSTKLNIKNGQ